MNFTTEQENIFDFIKNGKGHGIIDAVAGAGKTTTIMEGTRHVQDKTTVLFCAFNNSIANEIRNRFHQKGWHEVTVKTIHALGKKILDTNNLAGKPTRVENNKYRELLKSKKIEAVLQPYFEQIIFLHGLDPHATHNKNQIFAVKNLLYKIKARLLDINQKYRATLTKDSIEEFEKLVIHFGIFDQHDIKSNFFEKELAAYFECHKILLAAGNALSQRTLIIDFTDMLYLPFHWKQAPLQKFDFIFIDECQDLSKAQFAIAAKYGKRGGRIMAVGDPRQSIYGFTGADIESFNRVKEFTKATSFPLTVCFRCPQKVIQIAKEIRADISGNKTEAGVVKTIAIKEVTELAKPNDLIICRLKSPLVVLVFNFIDKNIRVQIHEDEANDFINELKRIFKPEELNADIARKYQGFQTLKDIVLRRWNWIIQKEAEKIKDPTERAFYIKNETAYLENRLAFFHKKYELWQNDCPTIIEILKRVKDFISEVKNPIRLSTIHRAKGLEENRVFIIDYDNLPYTRLNQKDWERVQEVNLKYVAVTRAKSELFLVESVQIAEMEEEGSLFDDLPF